jgi:prevent-host-death family protein
MTEVGVRELKRDLSGYLKRAADGEHIRVTVRGEPLVDLVPVGGASAGDEVEAHLDRLAAAGRLTRARRPKAPVRIVDLGLTHSPLEALLADRASEDERDR